jgi:uncharacterized protein (TIGR03435 family)
MEWPKRFVYACGAFTLGLGLLATSARLDAQNPAPAAPAAGAPSLAFEVASVKPNKSGENFIRFGLQPGGRFTALNVPARELIRFAYNVQPFQIEGGPGWLSSDRFDITAKAEGDFQQFGPGQLGPANQMMQTLLADRFKLKVHRETKEMPIYALVLARSDGRLGKQIEPSTTDCAAMRGRGAGPGRGGPGGPGGPPPAPPQPGERPQCGMFMGIGSVGAGDVPLQQLAQLLSQRVQRIVVDKTGLTGRYSFNIEFTPDQMPPPGGAPPGVQLPPVNPDGPSIFTALQEQLGLKLESTRGPVETLVIDSVEQPTPD